MKFNIGLQSFEPTAIASSTGRKSMVYLLNPSTLFTRYAATTDSVVAGLFTTHYAESKNPACWYLYEA